jgi:diaminopimelate epimerase
MTLAFLKMNGLGNDFVIVPEGEVSLHPGRDQVRAIADRATGVGCDQFITIIRSDRADVGMRIWNADGGEVEACGNATRCVGWLAMQASGRETATIETSVGVLAARRAGHHAVAVDMGEPGLEWRDIPLAWEMDTQEIQLDVSEWIRAPGCAAIGNPHVVFFVADAEHAPVGEVGPMVETHWLFPARINVEFAQILDPRHIRLKVWERGVGQTRACGTGACATLVAAHRRGLCERLATVTLDGGDLSIEWRESDNHVVMTGPVAVEFAGRLPAWEIPS